MVIGILCGLAEFVIIFLGYTLFNDKMNLIVISWHVAALIMAFFMIREPFDYRRTHIITIVGNFVPLLFEGISLSQSLY